MREFLVADDRAGHAPGLAQPGGPGGRAIITPLTANEPVNGNALDGSAFAWQRGAASFDPAKPFWVVDFTAGQRSEENVTHLGFSEWTGDATLYPLESVTFYFSPEDAGRTFVLHYQSPGRPEMVQSLTALPSERTGSQRMGDWTWANVSGSVSITGSVALGAAYWVTRPLDGAATETYYLTPFAPRPDPLQWSWIGAWITLPEVLETVTFRIPAGTSAGPVHQWIADRALNPTGTGGTIEDYDTDGTPHFFYYEEWTAEVNPGLPFWLEIGGVPLSQGVTEYYGDWVWIGGSPGGSSPPPELALTITLPADRAGHGFGLSAPDGTSWTLDFSGGAASTQTVTVFDPWLNQDWDMAVATTQNSVSLTHSGAPGAWTLTDQSTSETQLFDPAGSGTLALDLSGWFLQPEPFLLQVSLSRWGHGLTVRQMNGEEFPITSGASAGDLVLTNTGAWYESYWFYDGTAQRRPSVDFRVHDPLTGEDAPLNQTNLIDWIHLPAPEDVHGAASGGNGIRLTWSLGFRAPEELLGGGFRIERQIGQSGSWTTLATLSATDALVTGYFNRFHFIDSPLATSQPYEYRVTYSYGPQSTDAVESGIVQLPYNLMGDLDSDGLPDWWEDRYGLNYYYTGDAYDDSDQDGLTNLEEWAYHTNPHNTDSDSDGLLDGEEALLGTDPTLVDTDEDGIADGVEIANNTNPLDPFDPGPGGNSAATFAEWQSYKFNATQLADPAISGPLADPDHDQRPNLLEYAFVSEPFRADAPSPVTAFIDGGSLALRFPRSKTATDLSYSPLVTDDLVSGTWLGGSDTFDLANLDDTAPGVQWVTVRDWFPTEAFTARFARLKVTLLPAPLAPVNLVAYPAGLTSIALNWQATTFDAASFKIERSSDSGATWSTVATEAPSQFFHIDSGLAVNTTYSYRVRLQSVTGVLSAPSNVAVATTLSLNDIDTDGDGTSDGAEDADGDGTVDPDETDPNDNDSDDDGVTDGQELEQGLDPRNDDSDGDGVKDGADAYPKDERRSEDIPVQHYLAFDLSEALAHISYIGWNREIGAVAISDDGEQAAFCFEAGSSIHSVVVRLRDLHVLGHDSISTFMGAWPVNGGWIGVGRRFRGIMSDGSLAMDTIVSESGDEWSQETGIEHFIWTPGQMEPAWPTLPQGWPYEPISGSSWDAETVGVTNQLAYGRCILPKPYGKNIVETMFVEDEHFPEGTWADTDGDLRDDRFTQTKPEFSGMAAGNCYVFGQRHNLNAYGFPYDPRAALFIAGSNNSTLLPSLIPPPYPGNAAINGSVVGPQRYFIVGADWRFVEPTDPLSPLIKHPTPKPEDTPDLPNHYYLDSQDGSTVRDFHRRIPTKYRMQAFPAGNPQINSRGDVIFTAHVLDGPEGQLWAWRQTTLLSERGPDDAGLGGGKLREIPSMPGIGFNGCGFSRIGILASVSGAGFEADGITPKPYKVNGVIQRDGNGNPIPLNNHAILHLPVAFSLSPFDPFAREAAPEDGEPSPETDLTHQVSADDGEVWVEAYVSLLQDDPDHPGNPIMQPVPNGSIIEWELLAGSDAGIFAEAETPTEDGFAAVKFYTTRKPGDLYKVRGRIKQLAWGAALSIPVPTSSSRDSGVIEVVPGIADSITSVSAGSGDGLQVTVTAKDTNDNTVAEGTEVYWHLKGPGRLINASTVTNIDGEAAATIKPGSFSPEQVLYVEIDGFVQTVPLPPGPLPAAPPESPEVASLAARRAAIYAEATQGTLDGWQRAVAQDSDGFLDPLDPLAIAPDDIAQIFAEAMDGEHVLTDALLVARLHGAGLLYDLCRIATDAASQTDFVQRGIHWLAANASSVAPSRWIPMPFTDSENWARTLTQQALDRGAIDANTAYVIGFTWGLIEFCEKSNSQRILVDAPKIGATLASLIIQTIMGDPEAQAALKNFLPIYGTYYSFQTAWQKWEEGKFFDAGMEGFNFTFGAVTDATIVLGVATKAARFQQLVTGLRKSLMGKGNNWVGRIGETVAEQTLRREGRMSELMPLQGKSGNGIDLAGFDRSGNPVVIEVKSHWGEAKPRLSDSQKNFQTWATSHLENLRNGAGVYEGASTAKRELARRMLDAISDDGKILQLHVANLDNVLQPFPIPFTRIKGRALTMWKWKPVGRPKLTPWPPEPPPPSP